MSLADTIVAIATPPGRGGIGIVRLSGERSLPIARALVRTAATEWRSWSPTRALLFDAEGAPVDDVIVTWYARPRSYTAEDVVEIACHGSPPVLIHAVERALAEGARLAEPGEFTLRAFVNGRIDLLQAEAVRDLIDATTLHQARVAAQQAGGAVARRVRPIKTQLIDLIAMLEAGIDFAEDDVDVPSAAALLERLNPIELEAGALLRSFEYGRLLREGFSLAILGRPNVGKSSLFNRLLERDRAIVTDMPGTTRDAISEGTAIGGIPVRLVDTAGIREGESLAETLGIERSWEAMADAHLALVVVDAVEGMTAHDTELFERARLNRRAILVANKRDLGSRVPEGALAVSALTGAGIDELRDAIGVQIGANAHDEGGAILSHLRHKEAATEAAAGLRAAREAIAENRAHEFVLLDLYAALAGLDSLTGKTSAEDILHRIFATFCIGK